MAGPVAVLLAKQDHFQIPALAKALGVFKNMPAPDATRLARDTWGIVGENMTDDEGRALCAELEKAGLAGKQILMSELAALPAPTPATRWEWGTEADLIAVASIETNTTKTIQNK